MFNIFTGASEPMSATAKFFDPMFGYTAAEPGRVYKDLVNAYRLLRLGAHANAHRVPAALRGIGFGEWMARVARVGVLPRWWDGEVNGAGIEVYAREDAWGRIDRVVTKEEVKASVARQRVLSLEMIVEKVLNNS